jgi:hypothetical protein
MGEVTILEMFSQGDITVKIEGKSAYNIGATCVTIEFKNPNIPSFPAGENAQRLERQLSKGLRKTKEMGRSESLEK